LVDLKKRGLALDPVANFHFNNGAMLHSVNWMANPTEKGMKESYGIMVNYLYKLDMLKRNGLPVSSFQYRQKQDRVKRNKENSPRKCSAICDSSLKITRSTHQAFKR